MFKKNCIWVNGPGCHHYCLLFYNLVSKYLTIFKKTNYQGGQVNKRERELGGAKNPHINNACNFFEHRKITMNVKSLVIHGQCNNFNV